MALIPPFPEFTYHPHQSLAVQWMVGRETEDALYFRGGILADEMGLGKTWMTIGLILNNPVPQTLLLLPPVLISQWSTALTQAGIIHRILDYTPRTGARFKTVGAGDEFSLTLATYDRAARNRTLLTDSITYDRIICDEGHLLRNGDAIERFKSLIQIEADRRWILSGTPVQNNKKDILNLYKFLGADAITDLKSIVGVTLLRRVVSEVRDAVPTMPVTPPTHIVHRVVMPEGEEKRVFEALVGRFEHAIETHAAAFVILELYMRIRQFVAHPAIYVTAMKKKFRHLYTRAEWLGSASKDSAFCNWLAREPYEPTIVFGTFRKELEYAAANLRANGYTTFLIRGGLTDSARAGAVTESIAAAERGERIAIVVQIIAGGAGLNLQHCNRIVFLSSHWNPCVVDQAIARAYRIGQTRAVSVHHFLLADDAEKNLDRKMAALHGKKRRTAINVHSKLFCDSAVSESFVFESLDEVADAVIVE